MYPLPVQIFVCFWFYRELGLLVKEKAPIGHSFIVLQGLISFEYNEQNPSHLSFPGQVKLFFRCPYATLYYLTKELNVSINTFCGKCARRPCFSAYRLSCVGCRDFFLSSMLWSTFECRTALEGSPLAWAFTCFCFWTLKQMLQFSWP